MSVCRNAVVAVGHAGPVLAKDKKASAVDQLVKRLEEDIKGYGQKRKAAQEKMKAANAEGEEVEPLIEPTEKEMLRWKEAMEEQQVKRVQASSEMQEKIKADPKIEEVRLPLEKVEAKCDELAAVLLPSG